MTPLKKLVLLLCSFFISTLSFAQDKPVPDEFMRSNGKIYVVVASCLTILLGLFFYVFWIDKKISKIENEN